MKKVVLGFIVGALVSTGIQVSAIEKRWCNYGHEIHALNAIGEVVFEVMETQDKIYSKLKSIDERLAIENSKGY